jgi:IS30 family transposase
VVERLKAGWSPQQIAGRLKREAPDRPSVCHETIYRHVYGPDGRRDDLYRHLPRARRRRGFRHGRRPRATPIPRERWIENRPAEVDGRESFGHWECDLLLFRKEHQRCSTRLSRPLALVETVPWGTCTPMPERLITTKLTPTALRLIRLIAASTGERQHQVMERLLKAEAGRLGLGDAA